MARPVSKIPAWIDEPGVRKLVDDVMDRDENEEWMLYTEQMDTLLEETESGLDLGPPLPSADHLQREAMAAARAGNLTELADLILIPSWRARLPAEAWELIHSGLVGYRYVDDEWVAPWPPRRGRGRPPISDEERYRSNPVHAAAEQVPVIKSILRDYYPDQTTTQIRDRALTFAAARAGMKTPDPAQTLADYMDHGGIKRRRKRAKKK